MRRCSRWLPVALLLALASPSPRAAGADEKPKPKPVKLEKTWNGIVPIGLRGNGRPGYIADKTSWEDLWKRFRGGEAVPAVDFDTELVLVAVNSDPNGIGIGASLDDKGDLMLTSVTTLKAFINPTTCAYQLAVVKRDGIKTIGGNPIVKAEPPAKPAK